MTDHCCSRFPAAASATPTGARKSRAATLADVSRIAGVSVMAVSAALNGGRTSARVSARTRERILAVAACLGYRRNPVAHALASRRARRRRNTLAVAMASPASSPVGPLGGFLGVLDGILSAAARHRHDITLFILGAGWLRNRHPTAQHNYKRCVRRSQAIGGGVFSDKRNFRVSFTNGSAMSGARMKCRKTTL